MQAVRKVIAASAAISVLAVSLSLATACSSPRPVGGGIDNAHVASSGAPSTRAYLYPVPVAPNGQGQGTFFQFKSGWFGGATMTNSGVSECTNDPLTGFRAFRASTGDFAQFDSGSANPGQDFSIELTVDPISSQSDNAEPVYTMSMTYVSPDGTHNSLFAQADLAIKIVDREVRGAGFSATTQDITPERSIAVSISGFINCTTGVGVP